jgi:hypothetical protein
MTGRAQSPEGETQAKLPSAKTWWGMEKPKKPPTPILKK